MTATPWTLRFTDWSCGHHGQRPEDIPCSSPQQAKAILWAIACAISQPGHARAMLFTDTRGFSDLYVTDDYCEFNPESTPAYRPEVVLCADEATLAAILAPDLKQAREELAEADLTGARAWDGREHVDAYNVVVTTMPRADVEKLADIDDSRLDPSPLKFELPPIFHDGAEILRLLREQAASIAEWDARMAAEPEEENPKT